MKTRDQIVGLAIELIQQSGDQGWSYEDIASKVGIRKASIHYHFPSKEDLIVEASRVYIAKVLSEIERGVKHAEGIVDRLLAIAGCYRKVFCQKGRLCLCISLTRCGAKNGDAFKTLIEDFYKRVHQIIKQVVEEEQAVGNVGKHVIPKDIATAFLAQLQGLLLMKEYGWESVDFDHAFKQMLNFLEKNKN